MRDIGQKESVRCLQESRRGSLLADFCMRRQKSVQAGRWQMSMKLATLQYVELDHISMI